MSAPSRPILPARILVVDDEAMPRMTITRALSLMGYKADQAASGAEALSKLSARFYDLVLLDLRMPGVDGVEVMRQARSLCPDTLVIVLTAHATLDSAIAAVRFGAVDYLLKPYSLRDTEAAIARALERRPGSSEGEPPPTGRTLQRGPVTLDLEKRTTTVSLFDGTTLQAALTGNEAALLLYLMQSPDTVFSCHDLAARPSATTSASGRRRTSSGRTSRACEAKSRSTPATRPLSARYAEKVISSRRAEHRTRRICKPIAMSHPATPIYN